MVKRHRTKDARKEIKLPAKFQPRFWVRDTDGRCAAVKEIRERVETLKQDTQADSYQKQLICERAVFVALKLETMEIEATESGQFDMGVYTQAVNCLMGCLKALGLEKQVPKTLDLKAYKERRHG